ncbi:hypothetical protein NTGBS_580011 [Candidatus Nitrotoga sp. BS]|nr:hypothetical protein NTGBS_580011 [Candidatus Nitrotoga sp. BS]
MQDSVCYLASAPEYTCKSVRADPEVSLATYKNRNFSSSRFADGLLTFFRNNTVLLNIIYRLRIKTMLCSLPMSFTLYCIMIDSEIRPLRITSRLKFDTPSNLLRIG